MGTSRWTLVAAAIAFAALALPLAGATHAPTLRVGSDVEFSADHWSGTGDAADPYRPRVTSFTAQGGYGIELANTRKHVNLSGVTITGGGGASDGIHLFNVRNVSIWGATLETNRIGIHIRDSEGVSIAGTTVKTSSAGILLERSRGVTLDDNRIALNDKDVQFRQAQNNTLRGNNLSTATGQVGLFFEDNASYDNTIDTTNVVNAIPVRWYTNVVGPVVISDVRVDLSGMTNVAQIMLHNASGVRLERPVAKAGIAAGIHVHRGSDVSIVDAAADNNGASGVFVELSDATTLSGGGAHNNTGSGVVVQSSTRTLVDSASLGGNHGAGATVRAASNDSILRNLTVSANGQRGVLVESSANATLASSTLARNGGVEAQVVSSRDIVVKSNTLSGAGATGIAVVGSTGRFDGNTIRDRAVAVSLTGTSGSAFASNVITLATGGTGFAFDSPASYDNTIATSNTVNGTAVRWYTHLAGTALDPVRLDDLSVHVRGITNVAQVMLYRTQNVTLMNASVTDGAAAGLVLYESQEANVSGGRFDDNVAQGILAVRGGGLRLTGAVVLGSGGDGIRLMDASAPTIENTRVERSGGRGFAVETGSTPTLRGNAATSNAGAGIHLDRTGPGAAVIDHNVVQHNGGGIAVGSSVLGSMRGNTLRHNGGDGIHLAGVPTGARVQDNTLEDHTRGIRLAGAEGTELTGNVMVVRSGQWGVHFDDEASYNVTLPPSNTVNGVPIRWYVGEVGSATEPVVVADVRAEERGLTNVAQVMLYKVRNVTLQGAVAANGTHRGVFAYASENVTVQQSRAENNSLSGVEVRQSPDARVNDTSARNNSREGVGLAASPRATLVRVVATGNGGAGMHVASAAGLAVTDSALASNAGAGLVVSGGSESPGRLERTNVSGNAGGVSLAGTWFANVSHNDIRGNGASGLSLSGVRSAMNVTHNVFSDHTNHLTVSGTTYATWRNNTVALAAGETAWVFADDVSRRNTIDPSNVVAGVPMQWYAGLRNATLSDVRVEIAGMTNHGQVGIFDAENVTLDDVRAGGGRSHGIVVESSRDVRVVGSFGEGNGGSGLYASGVARLEVRNATFAHNAAHGVALRGSSAITLDNSTLRGNVGNGLDAETTGTLDVFATTARANGGAGVSARHGPELNVSRSAFSANAGEGLHAQRGGLVFAYDNVFADNGGDGLRLTEIRAGARVHGNTFANHTRGLRFEASEFAELRGNSFDVSEAQTALHFSDERSYNNAIDTTNLVNGWPVRWYTMLSGTESNPVRLEGVRAEVRGMTNVAQVMVYRSAYVQLPELVATNGTHRGLYLHRSSSITVEDANLSGNTLAGAHLHATQSSAIRGARAFGSAKGVELTESHNNVVAALNASGSAVGVSLASGSRDSLVHGVEMNGTSRGVVDAGWDGRGLVGGNLIVDAGAQKRVKMGGQASFADATATYRHESSRIVRQTWSWGDGSADLTSASGEPLRPLRAYPAAGEYRATLTVETADAQTLADTVRVDVVLPLSEPRSLTALAGARNVTLTWEPPQHDGAAPITGYRVFGGTDPATLRRMGEIGDTRLVLNGLENGVTYHFAVAAVNADGEGPRAQAVAMPAAPPGPPTALVAKSSPNASALTWAPPASANGLPVTGYVVLRSVGGAPLGPVAILANVTAHTDVGLVNGVEYTYAVRATNGLGSGAPGANATVTPVGPASAPRTLRALPGDASVTLLWAPPSDNGGTPLVEYRVWRAGENGSLVQLPATIPANASSFRDTGLSNGQGYAYSVSAVTAYGEGARSPNVTAVPEAVDVLRPVLFAHEPADGAVLREAPTRIGVQYVDNDGVVLESVRLYLDGALVGAEASPAGVSYAVPNLLTRGAHEVRVVVGDDTGNEANETWSFRVLGEEDFLARFEFENLTLVPERAMPGDVVTARVTVRNVGYAQGEAHVHAMLANASVADARAVLAEGDAVDLLLEFAAPAPGLHVVEVAGRPLSLLVDASEETPTAPETAAPPTPEEGEPPVEKPKRPVRSVPPPREEQSDVPHSLLGALLALAVAARTRRR